jgi:hypothetical protein
MLKVLVGWLAVLAALASAALWFWAARVPLDPRDFAAYGGLPPEAQRQFTKQVGLNGYAALATGISAALQAISLMM